MDFAVSSRCASLQAFCLSIQKVDESHIEMTLENPIEPAASRGAAFASSRNSPAFSEITLQTNRLLLRPLRDRDAPSVLAIFSDQNFMQFGTTPLWDSIDQAHAMINRDIKAMAANERIRLGVERIEDEALIGICTLFDWNKECRSAEVGYGLVSDAWGRGYMHEALVALLNYGFSELDLNRVEADIDPRNINSARSLERIGFTKEGHLRESCVVNGVLTDSALYGLLRREWKAM
ncbi:GNAT family protein [Paraburkholderia bryophila]|uniref:GNAT family N-acetyltransferase n=1 Tax=Burkholderiaceae TaxID=119060 RepID=UPI001E5654C0|nr:GNAT family protein [Burkholderia sp. 9120]